MICFWGAYRPARGIGSEQVFRLPVAGWLIETLGGIPFPKGAKDGEAIRKLVAAYEEASDSAASADFTTCLHQGDPLGAAAVRVPKDIPVFQVDEWDQAAVHALEEKDPLPAPAAYTGGKSVADHEFSKTVVDKQLGVCAMITHLQGSVVVVTATVAEPAEAKPER